MTFTKEKLAVLATALKNAVKPNYDIHVTCTSCDKEITTNNSEWLLWCGKKEHAQVLIDAGKALPHYITALAEAEKALVVARELAYARSFPQQGTINLWEEALTTIRQLARGKE